MNYQTDQGATATLLGNPRVIPVIPHGTPTEEPSMDFGAKEIFAALGIKTKKDGVTARATQPEQEQPIPVTKIRTGIVLVEKVLHCTGCGNRSLGDCWPMMEWETPSGKLRGLDRLTEDDLRDYGGLPRTTETREETVTLCRGCFGV